MAIYYSDDYLTDPPAGSQPIRHTRIGHHTYTRDLSASDVVATSEQTGGPKDAVLRPDTYERWKSASPVSVLTFNFPESVDSSYIAIAAHNLGTSGGSVTLEYSNDGGNTINTYGSFSPSDDGAIIFQGLTKTANQWRITVFANTTFEIGVVYIGKMLEMQRPIYGGHAPVTLSRTTTIRTSRSRSGQFLGQQYRRKGYETSISFSNLKADWIRETFDPFIEDARTQPYFMAWRPSQFPKEVGYVWTGDDIVPSNSGTRDLMDVSWDMVGFDE